VAPRRLYAQTALTWRHRASRFSTRYLSAEHWGPCEDSHLTCLLKRYSACTDNFPCCTDCGLQTLKSTKKIMEIDRAMASNLWNYSSYSQPLYQRYDHQSYANHHHHPHRYQMHDALPPILKSSQPYCGLNYAPPTPCIAADSEPGAWKVTRGKRQWSAALGRTMDAAAAMEVAAQRCWTPYPPNGT